MASVLYEGTMCECCLMLVANGDDSGCRDYYGHTHAAPTLPSWAVRECDQMYRDIHGHPAPRDGIPWSAWLVVGDTDPSTGYCELCNGFDGMQTVYGYAVIR